MPLPWPRRPKSCRPGSTGWARCRISAAAPCGALAWLLGGYGFDRYKKKQREGPRLVMPPGVDGEEISRIAENLFLARDLINTPANDMGPAELEAAARALAKKHGAKFVGDQRRGAGEKLSPDRGGGAGSPRAPRLIELSLGQCERAAGDAGGQGRLLRYRRP